MFSPYVSATICDWRVDAEGMAALEDLLRSGADCDLPPGLKGWKVQTEIVDEYGHVLDGDFDPKGEHGCQHTDTPEWKAAHQRPRKKAVAKVAPPKEKQMEPLIPPAAAAEVPVAAPQTTATVSVPTDGFDLSQIIPKDGHITASTVVLAAIVVLGVLAMRLLPSQLKARNEREAKKLELEEQRISQQKEQQNQSHQCDTSHAALAAQISDLSAKIDGVVKKSSSFAFGGEDFSAEDFAEWRESVDKALKVKASKKKAD